MANYESVIVERQGPVAILTMNRPEKMNTFNAALRRDMCLAARELNLDTSIQVVLLTGAGRAFGAGADLTEAQGDGLGGGAEVQDQLEYEY